MHKSEKERVVAELTERLRSVETLIVSDYRGLTMTQIDDLRSKLLEHGARFTVVKNTLTRRAAEAAGVDTLLALLEGPTAIAFLDDSDGDAVAVAKALADAARETRVLAIRGGVLQGRAMSAEEVESLAKLPSPEILRGQLVGALAGPLTMVVGLFTAPLRDLVGVIDARIRQLEEQGGEPATSAEAASGTETQAEGGAAAAPEAEDASGTETQAEGGEAADAGAETPEPEAADPAAQVPETHESTTEET